MEKELSIQGNRNGYADKLKISGDSSGTQQQIQRRCAEAAADDRELCDCGMTILTDSVQESDVINGAEGGKDENCGVSESEDVDNPSKQTTKLQRKAQVKTKRMKKSHEPNVVKSDNERCVKGTDDGKFFNSDCKYIHGIDDEIDVISVVSEASQGAHELKGQSSIITDKSNHNEWPEYFTVSKARNKKKDRFANKHAESLSSDDDSTILNITDEENGFGDVDSKWIEENLATDLLDELPDVDLSAVDFSHLFDDPDDFVMIHHLHEVLNNRDINIPPKPLFPCSDLKSSTECQICLVDTSIRERLCCRLAVCEDCMNTYIEDKVNNGCVTIACIGDGCDSFVHRDEIIGRLDVDMKEKYQRFLANANNDPMVKTCPRCCYVHTITSTETEKQEKKQRKKYGIKVVCTRCNLQWCFPCQAPWHEQMTCKEYNKGNKLLKSWAKEHSFGQINARKCPKCKIFIERRGGCDHMSCNRCGASFCYRCGERYISLKLIGDHYGRYSPFGCKFNLLPNKPAARRAVRGGVLGAKILGGVLLGGLIIVAGAVVLGTSCISLPIYGAVKYRDRRKRKKILKRQRHNFMFPRVNDMALKPPMIKMLLSSEVPVSDPPEHGAVLDLGPLPLLGIPETIFETESISASTTAASPDSGSETEHAQEVEVWVHCQQQTENGKQEVNVSEHARQEKDGNITTTAKLSKDENDSDVLNVRTSYSVKSHSPDIQSIKSNSKDEAAGKNSSQVQDNHRNASTLQNSESENDSDVAETENQDLKGEVVSGDENSTSQGCFVQFFGKKLPVVWEKDNKDITEDAKLSTDKDQGKHNTGSLEKKHAKDSNVGLSEKFKTKKKSGKFKAQPDIVNCVLQSQQGKNVIVKQESDPDVLTVAKQFSDSDIEGIDSSQTDRDYRFDDSQCVVSMENYVTRL